MATQLRTKMKKENPKVQSARRMLVKAVRDHGTAEVDSSWAGSRMPAEHEGIERALQQAQRTVLQRIEEFEIAIRNDK